MLTYLEVKTLPKDTDSFKVYAGNVFQKIKKKERGETMKIKVISICVISDNVCRLTAGCGA